MVIGNCINHGSRKTDFYLTYSIERMEILVFGALTDLIGTDRLVLDAPRDTEEMKQYLLEQYPGLGQMQYFLALNKIMVTDKQVLQETDVLALMPAFSGG